METVRRVRRRATGRTSDEIDFKKREQVGHLIGLVVQRKAELAEATLSLADAEARLLAAMQDMKLVETKEGRYIATVERPSGRTTNVVDPRKFYAAVDEDEFFSAVSVSLTEARKVVPAKTLDKMTTKIPGKVGDPRVKVEEVKVDAKLKKAK